MTKREAERALRAAGFVWVRTGRHDIWRCGQVTATLHQGTRADPRQAKCIKLALKRAKEQGHADLSGRLGCCG